MPTCPNCGTAVSEGTANCTNCGAPINQTTSVSVSQPQVTMEGSPAWPNTSGNSAMSARLQKALRRTELLSYAAAGLAVALLVVILLLSFL
jgi:uncharacterized membrane protein YvbJ